MIAVIVSEKNIASMNIYRHLQKAGASNVHVIADDLIHAEDLDKKIHSGEFVFACTHRSKDNKPALCVHSIGNWGSADLGGKEGTLVDCAPSLVKQAFLGLKKANLPGYDVTLEATHHGPYLDKPTLFIEIGATEKEWRDEQAGEAVAKVIMSLEEKKSEKVAFGLGGTHYCAGFNKILERTDIAIGHICPKYLLEKMDEEMLKQAIEKSGANMVLLDWKGLGSEKQRIVGLLKKFDIEVKRTEKL